MQTARADTVPHYLAAPSGFALCLNESNALCTWLRLLRVFVLAGSVPILIYTAAGCQYSIHIAETPATGTCT